MDQMDLEFWATTDVGRVRDHNEDNFLVDKRLNLFVVCDGMGGHAAGEVASAITVRVVREVISNHPQVFERLEEDPDQIANRKALLTVLEHAISEACQRVWQAAEEDPSRRGMGTTCSLLLMTQGRGFIGHVGDSRIYLHRQGQIHQITEDHSLVNEMIRLGKLKEGEEHNLKNKNAVTRAVGVNEFVEVDTFELDVFAGDSFLLCSDGLSGYFEDDDQIIDLLQTEDVKEITEDAIDFANEAGGKDNITTIVVRVAGNEMEMQDIQRTMEVMRATPYFQYLSYKELVQLVNLSKRVEVGDGDTVVAEGSDPEAMYLVLHGKIALSRDGQQIGTLLPGDHFSESALVDAEPQTVTASALDDCVVLSIRRDRFMELLRHEPDLAVKLLWNFLQTFTIRMRKVPYEQFLTDPEATTTEPTPPSGTLVFEEDQRRAGDSESDAETTTRDALDSDAARLTVDPTDMGPPPSVRQTQDTVPSGDFQGPTDSVGQQLAWEGADASGTALDEDVVHTEEELRETVRMDRGGADPSEPTATMDRPDGVSPPDGTTEDSDVPRDTRPDEPDAEESGGRVLGKPISGSSVVKDGLPEAQVLSKGKLIVSDDDDSVPRGETEEVSSLKERLADKKKKEEREEDNTMELDVDDENVEEIT